MQRLTTVADYFVIASADNRVQLRALADETLQGLRQAGATIHHKEGYDETGWILLDLGDVVVHYFLEDRREFYGLERLLGDALRVEVCADRATGSSQER